MKLYPSLRYLVLVICVIPSLARAQTKPRIAVFPFDNRTTAPKDMNLENKIADDLISSITASGGFQIVDRQYLDRILAEKNLKYDPNFDSATAVRSGLLGTVDFIVAGQIDAYNANTQDQQVSHFGSTTAQTSGTVAMRATARIISIERGSVLSAPSADISQTQVLAKSTQTTLGSLVPKSLKGQQLNNAQGTKNVDQALRGLVDKATAGLASELSAKIDEAAKANESTAVAAKIASEPPPPAPAPTGAVAPPTQAKPKLVNVENGLVYINKGSATGVKVGDKFEIKRSIETTMKDPDTGQPLVKHKGVCSLVITSVEESFSSGKCKPADPNARSAENTPKSGDEIVPAGF